MTVTESRATQIKLQANIARDFGSSDEGNGRLARAEGGARTLDRRAIGRIVLLAADLTAIVSALVVSQIAFPFSASVSGGSIAREALVIIPVWLVLGAVYGIYSHDDRRPDHSTADELFELFNLLAVGALVMLVAASVVAPATVEPLRLAAFGALAFGFVVVARVAGRSALRRQSRFRERIAILGSGRLAAAAVEKLELANRRDVDLVGLFSENGNGSDASNGNDAGTAAGLLRLVGAGGVDRVVVAERGAPDDERLALLRALDFLDVNVDVVSTWCEALGPAAAIHDVRGLHVIGLPRSRSSAWSDRAKRAMDVVVASSVLLVALPFLALIGALVAVTSRGPILYRGGRIGMNGVRFEQLKFRTMRIEACRGERYGGDDAASAFAELMRDEERRAEFERTRKLTNDPRVTRIGGFLRRTSLDELPSLFNVLAGHLSVVGPRTVTVEEFAEQPAVKRSSGLVPYWDLPGVRPGITGYAVINGRARLSYAERVRLDMLYAANRSIRLDLRILAETARVLLTRDGAA